MNAVVKSAPYRQLLIGCGTSRAKRMALPNQSQSWYDLTTLDKLASSGANVVHDLNILPYPFKDNEFTEIHAYAILEHCGRQGDGDFFFSQFAEFYRILQPEGHFFFTVPMWNHPLAYGVPDHTRIMPKDLFAVLDPQYYNNLGAPGIDKADYREQLGSTHFQCVGYKESVEQLAMVLKAVK